MDLYEWRTKQPPSVLGQRDSVSVMGTSFPYRYAMIIFCQVKTYWCKPFPFSIGKMMPMMLFLDLKG
jgi:hypothetical protein